MYEQKASIRRKRNIGNGRQQIPLSDTEITLCPDCNRVWEFYKEKYAQFKRSKRSKVQWWAHLPTWFPKYGREYRRCPQCLT